MAGLFLRGIVKNGLPVKLLEIKCPFIGKKKPVIEFVHECSYLIIDNDRLSLRKKHPYYCQVQLGMEIQRLFEYSYQAS
ncbi:hypothetical protein JTB14_028182 [Gonioctena quinquepunctata]|nr:hypothetical protein JTB14_028182 [Gonioctena quinquepunctata]